VLGDGIIISNLSRVSVTYTVVVTGNPQIASLHTHTHTRLMALSGITQVSRYQKGKTNLDFTEARESE